MSEIKPALTAEEWTDAEHRVERDGFWIYEPPILDCPVVGSEGSGVAIGSVRHALAALALYNQPFGFTREDVRIIRILERSFDGYDPEQDDLVDERDDFHGKARSLADRIEALLPPEA